ncbi:MAG TPA: DUF1731 domain-containing protein, partial [Cytophagales bacterium]|nr:DUF1731 domain-containing protein [Cytophagales bacterium]
RHGSGMQKVSWIHVDDFIGAIHYMLIHKLPEGIYNVCAPNPTDNATLMAHLRKKNNMPAAVPLSTWMLHLGALLLQTEVELLLKSRWVLPTKLLMAGFKFKYPTIHSF